MYEQKFIDFLKEFGIYNEQAFKYMKTIKKQVNYKEEDTMSFIGCYPIMENNTVKDIRICVPKMIDDISVSINIHEYVHFLNMYNNLNKEYVFKNTEEVLPVLYEFVFLSKCTDIETKDYLSFYKEYIKQKDDEGLKVFLEIWNHYFEKDKEKLLKRI